MKDVLSLGAGVQSSALLLMSLRGELPRLHCAVFADTQYEPPAVYEHLLWLEEQARAGGIPVHRVTAGNIREDALEFRQHRRSSDGKRYASIPMFVANPDGKQGRLTRQCTKEFKIEPVEAFVRRHVLGLAPRQRAPKSPAIRQWMGITTDEGQRARYPGTYRTKKKTVNALFGPEEIEVKEWKPAPWKVHCYPFLDAILTPDRKSRPAGMWARTMSRDDCLEWLAANYPGRTFPRSACVCCPFRSNAEWRQMRDEAPATWADACDFDESARLRPEAGLTEERLPKIRKPLVGTIYVHRQMVPLKMADLSSDVGEKGAGCGGLFDEQDGLCGL